MSSSWLRACPAGAPRRDRRTAGSAVHRSVDCAALAGARRRPKTASRAVVPRWHARPHEPDVGPRALLPRRRRPRRALRRLVLHRRPHDRHLLPPVLPGPHPAGPQRLLLHHRRRRPRAPGFRACRRCRPDAVPGLARVGRARRRRRPRHAADRRRRGGALRRPRAWPRGSATPSASCTACSSAELGVGPLALARAQRAQTARLLIETTDLPMADVAFAAGFASIRQFNDTVREVFATTPSGAAARPARGADGGAPGWLTLRLAARAPYAADEVLLFLGAHAVPGLEEWDGTTFSRVLDLPHGPAVVQLSPAAGGGAGGHRPAAAGRAARPRRRRHPLPPDARPGRRPGRRRRRARRRPRPRPAGGRRPGPPGAGLPRRRRAGGARGARPAGVGGRRPHPHRAGADRGRHPAGRAGRHAHPRLPAARPRWPTPT